MATDKDMPVDPSTEIEAADLSVEQPAETDLEETDAQSTSAPAAPVPSFGLLFQPPTTVSAPPRRAPQPQVDDEIEALDDEDTDDQDDQASQERDDDRGRGERTRSGRGRGGRGRGRDEREAQGQQDGPQDDQATEGRSTEGREGDDSEPDAEADSEDNGSGEGGRRRRRRGGRGRNNRSGEAAEDSGDADDTTRQDEESDESDSSDESTTGGRGRGRSRGRGRGKQQDASPQDEASDDQDSTDEADEDSDDEGSASSRRRRRRRRGGNGGQDDPPGTVTKVRESRRNEPQGIKGSTRLEAKKQRRREGREQGRRRTIITEAEFLARRESVERVMVVRQHGDRTQIGVLEDGVLAEHYVSRETTSTMVGNVYLGRVQNVLPSMEAAFIDIGGGRNAVLYAGEVNWEAQGVGNGQARKIENALSSGDAVLVQVTKDPVGHKGARLTSQISLPGRYVVYVPEGSMTGISRKLPDTERARLKGILKQVVPDSAGVIVRTAAEGASESELTADVERLTKAWDKVSSAATAKKGKKGSAGGAPVLLHAEPDMTVRVIRDIFNEDFASMVVEGDDAWREIKSYVDDVAPDLSPRLEKFTGGGDVFAAHRIDEAIAKAMDRKVWLPSGGSLVIDRTEAMTVVDVNTGKFTGSGGNLEETVTKNNLEAAEEIVRQLRLRDIGGIIVVDFIDMVLEVNRDLVVRRLLECLGRDRTKHQVAEVTSLGLVQMTRKRVGAGLIEVFSHECEHCSGRGIVVHSEPVAHDPGGHGGNSGGGNGGGGGRSRRGRGKGGNEQDASPTPSSEPVEEQTDANGRTAAQIAAAAHAAAIKNIAGEPGEDDVAELDAPSTDQSEVSVPATPPEAPKRRRGGRRAASSAGAPVALEPVDLTAASGSAETSAPPAAVEPAQDVVPEPVVTPEPVVEPEPVDEPEAPKRRRGGRRAASSAGAPVALQPVDLTAPVEDSGSAPLTKVAGESGEAPTTPVADPEPAAPTRRKRKRVTSEAGPPQA